MPAATAASICSGSTSTAVTSRPQAVARRIGAAPLPQPTSRRRSPCSSTGRAPAVAAAPLDRYHATLAAATRRLSPAEREAAAGFLAAAAAAAAAAADALLTEDAGPTR